MLEEKDLQAIQSLLQDNNESIKKEIRTLHDSYESIKNDIHILHDSNENTKNEIHVLRKSLQDSNKSIKKEMRKSIVESEKMLLGEMDRMKGFFNARFEKLEDAVQELTQQYRLNQLESDNLSLLLQSIVNMQKEIEEIKKQIA